MRQIAILLASMPVPGCWDDAFDGAKARALWSNVRFNPDYQPIRFPTDNGHLVDPSFPFFLGTGWYRRKLDVPAAWKGREITLQVGRVVMDAWVYVNGREVHHHFGHSTNWELPLGPHLKFGQPNELVIAVDNTRTDRRLAIYQRPCLTHELGIAGCYINLKLEERYRKLRAGRDLYAAAREQLEKAGLLDRADVYYRASAAWQRLMLKDQMETARTCRLIAGYDCIGAADLQWPYCGYACGLMNEFDELKPGCTAEDIRCYNGESVLIVSRQRERNLVAGQPLQRKLLLSWFGDGALRDAPVRWSLKASNEAVLARGEQIAPEVEPGAVAPIATIDAPMPNLDRPTKATLTVELQCPGDRVRNQWDYWLFPTGESRVPDNVRVVTELDAATIDAIAAGQRVVLLGSKPFAARSTTFRIMSAGRAEGNLATVIARHPLTDQIPNDGYCDWQFFKMLSDAAAVQFDEMPKAFDPIVEVVSSYKQIHRQAAVFEWRVGSGRLLVCSLNLHDWEPAGACFRRCLLSYAGGEQFQPRIQVAPERLKQLLKLGPAVIKPAANPNQAFDPRRAAPNRKD